jgi:hypothetical protein
MAMLSSDEARIRSRSSLPRPRIASMIGPGAAGLVLLADALHADR